MLLGEAFIPAKALAKRYSKTNYNPYYPLPNHVPKPAGEEKNCVEGQPTPCQSVAVNHRRQINPSSSGQR